MTNKYGIPEAIEMEVRKRDVLCVYCHKEMKLYADTKGTPHDKATIEHLSNEGPFNQKGTIAMCCGSCNASRGALELLDWFQTQYCKERNINENTVAEPVRTYIQAVDIFLKNCTWIFAKTMPEIPHEYVVRDALTPENMKRFDALKSYILNYGYEGIFEEKAYMYLNIGKYKYWIIDNILNRDLM